MKKYNLEVYVGEDKKLNIKSTNDGFAAFELLGLFDFKKRDIERQILGEVEPDIVTRECVRD